MPGSAASRFAPSASARLWPALLAVAAVAVSCLAGTAAATTVGGLSTSGSGPFVLAGGRLVLPAFQTNNAGEGSPGPPVTETDTYLQSLGARRHDSRTLTLDASTSGVAPPAVSANGARVAAAWVGAHGLQSALVGGGETALRAVAMQPTSGAVAAYAVAVETSGARAVVWSDRAGLRLQIVAAGGAVAPPVTLAVSGSDRFTVSSDDAGGWWALWVAAGRLAAVDVAGNGAPGSTLDLGAAPATRAGTARTLRRGWWTVVADGRGGIWVGSSGALLHVGPGGRIERRASRHRLILAEGDRRAALAEDLGHGEVLILPIGRTGARPVLLRGLGALIDIAFDGERQATEVLSTGPRGFALTVLDRRDHITSSTLSGCPRRGTGEFAASGGLVGVACAASYFEADSVETGGDHKSGRYISYYLVRGARRLHGESFFEGYYAY